MPQTEHLLRERLAELGGSVEWNRKLVVLRQLVLTWRIAPPSPSLPYWSKNTVTLCPFLATESKPRMSFMPLSSDRNPTRGR